MSGVLFWWRCYAARLLLAGVGFASAACADDGPGDRAAPSLVYREFHPRLLDADRLVRIRADGTDRQVLVEGDDNRWRFGDIAASPDGRTILYRAVTRDGIHAGWFTVAVTGGASLLMEAPSSSLFWSWAPDGLHLAWSVFTGVGGALAVSSPGSATVTILTPDSLLVLSRPSWSPDGTRLTFAGRRRDSTSSPMAIYMAIYTVNLAGEVAKVTDGSGQDYSPAWSPDGSRIAFVRVDHPSEPLGIWLVAPDGSGARQLAPGAYLDVAWSPDGSALFASEYLGGSDGLEYLRMDATTGLVNRLFRASQSFRMVPAPWAGDGSWLAAVDYGVSSVLEGGLVEVVYTIRPDGTDFQRVVPDPMGGGLPSWIP